MFSFPLWSDSPSKVLREIQAGRKAQPAPVAKKPDAKPPLPPIIQTAAATPAAVSRERHPELDAAIPVSVNAGAGMLVALAWVKGNASHGKS